MHSPIDMAVTLRMSPPLKSLSQRTKKRCVSTPWYVWMLLSAAGHSIATPPGPGRVEGVGDGIKEETGEGVGRVVLVLAFMGVGVLGGEYDSC
jgi:hypothetical protein